MWGDFSRMPARSDVEVQATGDPRIDEAIGVFNEQLQFARNRGPHPEWPRISIIIQGAIQSALTGQKSAQGALDDAQAEISAILGSG